MLHSMSRKKKDERERDIEDNGGNITTATFFFLVKCSFGGSSHVDKLASVGLEQFNK
jgi:hypothetical protein